MNHETIIAQLEQINSWRRGEESEPQPDPKHVGEVIDAAVASLASLIASNTTLRRERKEARAEVAQLKGALALGQENCDAEYEELREERDKAKARCIEREERIEQMGASWDKTKADLTRVTAERDDARAQALADRAFQSDNAKTCAQIHFGAVKWLERYVKLLKIELHRQELANLRKKRTIRGLRKERSKMRALVKEACEGQAAKINAARVARMEGKRQFRLILVGHRTVYGVPVHSGRRLEEWRSDLGGGIWLYVDTFPSREDAESYVKNCDGTLEVLP